MLFSKDVDFYKNILAKMIADIIGLDYYLLENNISKEKIIYYHAKKQKKSQ